MKRDIKKLLALLIISVLTGAVMLACNDDVAVTGVTLNETEVALAVGDTVQLTATVAPDNANNKLLSWTSSKDEVATVDNSGLVTAIANGTATITVTTKDGNKSATVQITVSKGVTGISLDITEETLNVGDTKQLTATLEPEDASIKTVDWTSSNDEVATVSDSGLVTAIAEGTAIITATTKDGNKTATTTITVHEHDWEPITYFDEAGHYVKSAVCRKNKEHTVEYQSIQINSADLLMQLAADINAQRELGVYTIDIAADIDLANKVWVPIKLSGYQAVYNKKVFIFNGNSHVISNLATNENFDDYAGLFGSLWSSVSLEINDLTLDNANIQADIEDNIETKAVGGFIGYIDSVVSVKITNSKIINSNINGAHWAGGLYGYLSTILDSGLSAIIDNCEVSNTSITSKGSVGGAFGHATGSGHSNVVLNNSIFKNNNITCSESNVKAGIIIGTVGAGEVTLTNCVHDSNTVIGKKETIERLYGRLAFAMTGSLTVDGAFVLE